MYVFICVLLKSEMSARMRTLLYYANRFRGSSNKSIQDLVPPKSKEWSIRVHCRIRNDRKIHPVGIGIVKAELEKTDVHMYQEIRIKRNFLLKFYARQALRRG